MEYKGKIYKEINICSSNEILTDKQIIELLPQLGTEGNYLLNSYRTAEISGAKCVEGFVICFILNENSVHQKVIRHCWNFKDDRYFDITGDFIWKDLPGENKEFFYYIIEEYDYSEYILNGKGEISFLSSAVNLANEFDQLLNQE